MKLVSLNKIASICLSARARDFFFILFFFGSSRRKENAPVLYGTPCSSIRLDETNTMVPILLLYITTYKNEKVIRGEEFRLKIALMVNLIFVSNAVFGFAVAITGHELMEVFRNHVRESRRTSNFRHFWLLVATILT